MCIIILSTQCAKNHWQLNRLFCLFETLLNYQLNIAKWFSGTKPGWGCIMHWQGTAQNLFGEDRKKKENGEF